MTLNNIETYHISLITLILYCHLYKCIGLDFRNSEYFKWFITFLKKHIKRFNHLFELQLGTLIAVQKIVVSIKLPQILPLIRDKNSKTGIANH